MQSEKSGSEPVSKNRIEEKRVSDRELVFTRTFDAPARIVFDAWTKPELFMRWWVPRSSGMQLLSCELDVRVGGKYRLVMKGDGGKEFEFFGTYKEIESPTRLSWTDEEFPGAGEGVTTVTLHETAGKTTLTLHQLFPSKEALDGAIGSAVGCGMSETFDQLDEFLADSKG